MKFGREREICSDERTKTTAFQGGEVLGSHGLRQGARSEHDGLMTAH
jgi:hypothetical protein